MGQPAVAADAVQAQLDDLAAAPAGDDDGLPHVPQAAVVRVVVLGEPPQVGLVGQGAGDLVGEGGPGPADDPSRRGHGGHESPAQTDPFGVPGFRAWRKRMRMRWNTAKRVLAVTMDGLP